MDIDACFKVGYVAKTHGLKGEVTVVTLPECPDLAAVRHVFIQHKSGLAPYFISNVISKGDKAYVRLDDIDTIEKAAPLKGLSVFIAKDRRPVPKRGEFYNDEVIGFEVSDQRVVLGAVRDVQEAGGNRFLVVDYRNREVLIPVRGPFIKSINRSKKKVSVELPDGFLDI